MQIQTSLRYTHLAKTGIVYNDVHIWCIENFGLPGERYLYHPYLTDLMTYVFKEEKDAVLFNLRWGGEIKKLTNKLV